jgi:putative acetyltransferase
MIRAESDGSNEDAAAIRAVNLAAFGGSEEADLVDKLRSERDVLLSLVAEVDDRVVGHILFSRMGIETASGRVAAVALAPVAVLPERQRQGIGEQLIRQGLALLRDRGEKIVIVLGHAGYYPRFGFSTDKTRSLESPFPPEVFMAMELDIGALDGVCGRVAYPTAFGL